MMTHVHDDDHDRGLAFDLATLAERRRVLGLMGLAGAGALLSGCNPFSGGESTISAKAAGGEVCVKHPAETAGPFPGDGTNKKAGQTVNVLTQSGVIREDIRTSFAGMTSVADGAQLDLVISLVNVSAACAPLAGRAVYIWHCDAQGRYSLYDTDDSNYLRGVGVTDDMGEVRFTTSFPGCYAGRWPHIHFEVFESPEKAATGKDSLLISQFAFTQDACKSVYAGGGSYAASIPNLERVSLEKDGIFADNTPEQVAAQTIAVTGDAAAGFRGSVTVGIAG
jgi:protocatechuate 3,4-dioxygenase beta subunit